MSDAINKAVESISIEELRAVPENEEFICMFSGGKDCGLALSMACQYGKPTVLIHIIEDDNKSLNHNHDIKIIQAQSKAMDIPVVFCRDDTDTTKYLYNLYRATRPYIDNGIKNFVMGTLYDELAYYKYLSFCQSTGMKLIMPLWSLSYSVLISEIEKRKLKSLITTIDTEAPSDILGKIFDRAIYNQLTKLNLDAFGEKGEYHSTLIDADFFHYPLSYDMIQNDGENLVIHIHD